MAVEIIAEYKDVITVHHSVHILEVTEYLCHYSTEYRWIQSVWETLILEHPWCVVNPVLCLVAGSSWTWRNAWAKSMLENIVGLASPNASITSSWHGRGKYMGLISLSLDITTYSPLDPCWGLSIFEYLLRLLHNITCAQYISNITIKM